MSKKFVNKGNSIIAFERDLRVKPGETIELSDEVLNEKKDAMEIMLEAGQLKEVSKEKPKAEKPKDKKTADVKYGEELPAYGKKAK